MKQGWEEKKICDVCEIQPSKSEARRNYNGSITVSFMPMEDLKCEEKYSSPIKERKLEEVISGYTYFAENDVLLAKITPCFENGKVGIANNLISGIGFGSSEYVVFRAKESLSNEFLYYFLSRKQFRDEGKKRMTGAVGHKRVVKDFIENHEIPVPPLSEQKRIVAILDEAFTAIAKAKENAEKNLQNAKELFESYLQSVFANKGEGWEEKKLGDVCIVDRGSSPRPIDEYFTTSKDGVNWIKIGDTKNVDKYIYTTKQKITKEGALRSRLVVDGDFILSNSMSFGKPFVIKTTGYIHDGWFVLRLNENIDTDYFYNLLISPNVQNQFKSLSAGAIVKNISGDLVKKTILPIPPMVEQKSIVKRVESLSAKTKKLESIYKQKLSDLDELKKTILQKAFNGELNTTRDIEGV